jgi:lipopolysaccharide/colanic/teichoic acid biosynthesis glycosyltransferase
MRYDNQEALTDVTDEVIRGAFLRQHKCAAGRYMAFKLALEWVLSLLLLIVTAPLVALMAVLTRLGSAGPAFYSQNRVGRNGQIFRIYKIRTMVQDSEARTGPVWASVDDARVTRLGRFLRETHLDELPQLWNVLRGEMSLIGPRPERPELACKLELIIPRYNERTILRPGITGLAQVQRPADTSVEDVRRKLEFDLYYGSHVSLWLDLRILLCTVLHLTGVGLNSIGKLMVRSYGSAVERDLINAIPLMPECRRGQLGVA